MSELYTYGVYRAGQLVFSSEPMSEADAEGAAEWMRLLESDDSVVEVKSVLTDEEARWAEEDRHVDSCV